MGIGLRYQVFAYINQKKRYMERNVFKLMSSERATSNVDYSVNSFAGEYRIEIRSRKQKLVNGKVTETTTPSCKATIAESWLHYRVEVDSQFNILNFYLTVAANNSVNSRISTVTIKQDESDNTIYLNVTQPAQITEQDITLTLKLPMENVTGALFADGETPVNSGGVGGYFSFHSMFGQFSWTFKPSVGILVNLSSLGSTKYAKPGDRVKVYQFASSGGSSGGGTWSYMATFTMPSKDETIIL